VNDIGADCSFGRAVPIGPAADLEPKAFFPSPRHLAKLR